MNYVMLKLNANYADEFDVNALSICTKDKADLLLKRIEKNFQPNREYCFDTNEYLDFSS